MKRPALKYSPIQQLLVGLLLVSTITGCSPEKKPAKRLSVPARLKEVYQISQQVSYPLFDCDTTVTEVRVWESVSRITSTDAIILQGNTVLTHVYYLKAKNDREKKVIATISRQDRIIDSAAEKQASLFEAHGGIGLTLHKGVESAIDSLFKLGFADMQSQSQEEDLRVGDGISYIIEVRQGSFYKYVYYHSPEYFKNEPAQKFIRAWHFLTSGRLRIPKY